MIAAEARTGTTERMKDWLLRDLSFSTSLTKCVYTCASFSVPLKQRPMCSSSKDSCYHCLQELVMALTPDGDREVGRKIQGEMDFK